MALDTLVCFVVASTESSLSYHKGLLRLEPVYIGGLGQDAAIRKESVHQLTQTGCSYFTENFVSKLIIVII